MGGSKAPEALQSADLPQDYVLIVGVRGKDGTLQLLHEPVTEESLVRKAVEWSVTRLAGGCGAGFKTWSFRGWVTTVP